MSRQPKNNIFNHYESKPLKKDHILPLIQVIIAFRLLKYFIRQPRNSGTANAQSPLYNPWCRLAKAPPKSLNLEISTSAKLLTWPYLRQVCQYRQEFPVLGRRDRVKRRSGRSAPSARRHRRNPKPPPPASQQPFGPGGWQSEGSIKTQWPKFIGNEDLDTNDNMHN